MKDGGCDIIFALAKRVSAFPAAAWTGGSPPNRGKPQEVLAQVSRPRVFLAFG